MGVLGEAHGTARAEALRRQAAAYEPLTSRRILRAYHLSPLVDLVLDMDGFGSQQLKQSSYRAVMREPLQYPGIKLFYRQDVSLFTPAEVLALSPSPVVIVYQ